MALSKFSLSILSAAILGVSGHMDEPSSLRGSSKQDNQEWESKSSSPNLIKQGYDYTCLVKGEKRTLCRTVLLIDERKKQDAKAFVQENGGIVGEPIEYYKNTAEENDNWLEFKANVMQSKYYDFFVNCQLEEVEIQMDEPLALCRVWNAPRLGWASNIDDDPDANFANKKKTHFRILQEIYTGNVMRDQVKWVWQMRPNGNDGLDNLEGVIGNQAVECLRPISADDEEDANMKQERRDAVSTAVSIDWHWGDGWICGNLCDFYSVGPEGPCDTETFSGQGVVSYQTMPMSLNYINFQAVPMAKRMFTTSCAIGYETINVCTSVMFMGRDDSVGNQVHNQLGVTYGYKFRIKEVIDDIQTVGVFNDDNNYSLLELCRTVEVPNVPADTPLAHCGFANNKLGEWLETDRSIDIYQSIANEFGAPGGSEKYRHKFTVKSGRFKAECWDSNTAFDESLYVGGTHRAMWFSKAKYGSNCDASVYFPNLLPRDRGQDPTGSSSSTYPTYT